MPEHDPAFIVFASIWFAVVGACIGSFLNVLLYRLPRKKSLVYPPSHCPHCGYRIPWYDNVPVFGWIKLRGKCRECRCAISVRYPCVEGFCGLLFGGVFVLLGQYGDISLLYRGCLTLLGSLPVLGILVAGLMWYDKRSGVS